MYIARILYPVTVLGPGKRIAIWMAGCNHRCIGCSNPELWEKNEKYYLTMDDFKEMIDPLVRNNEVDGFTITGGDPFCQPESLRLLLPFLHDINNDILVYTGDNYEDVERDYSDVMKYISVLVDGEYIEERNYGLTLRGSDNQRIIIIDHYVADKYAEYLKYEKSKIQNFTTKTGIISVGIHLPDYERALKENVLQIGLREENE